jgi:hypothetical protein
MTLDQYMTSIGITNAQLAKLVGVSDVMVHYWRRKGAVPKMRLRAAIDTLSEGAVNMHDDWPKA